MAKKWTDGCFLYMTGMEGIESLSSLLESDPRRFFKSVYVDGVGIKKIDKIEGNTITFNSGYKAIDNHVVYEVYNNEISILTTVKKIDGNNLECSSDLSALEGSASLRIPPVGLKYLGVTSSGGSDIYENADGAVFLISGGGYVFAQESKDSKLYVGGYSQLHRLGSDVLLVSKHEIMSPPGIYVGIAKDGAPAASSRTTYSDRVSEFKVIYNDIITDDPNNIYLFPVVSTNHTDGLNVGIERSNPDITTGSTVISRSYVGKNRSELHNIRASSSKEQEKAIDFYIAPSERVKFISHDGATLALVVANSSNRHGILANMAVLE